MDGPGINQKIRYGYAKAAAKLGQDFLLYRAAVPVDPIDEDNLIGTIKAVVTIDWKWMKSNKPGNAIFWLVVDGQASSYPDSAEIGDYLVGDGTYFVLTKEYQMPMSAVQCNNVVSIVRPTQPYGPGNQGYVAYPGSGETEIFTNMPASVLKDRREYPAPSKLPTDTSEPGWIVMLPNLGGIEVITGDVMTDEQGIEYIISMAEKTDSGWRITVKQTVNG